MIFSPGDIPLPVTWYFVPWSNPVMPFPHSFGSSNWSDFKDIDGPIGEQHTLGRFWRNGQPYDPPDPRCGQGLTSYLGSEYQWRFGCPVQNRAYDVFGGAGLGGPGMRGVFASSSGRGGRSHGGSATVTVGGTTTYTSLGGASFSGP
jgi:hypothetical protein